MVWRRAFSGAFGAAVSESLSEGLLGLLVLLVATSFAWGAQTATPESSTAATSSNEPTALDDQRIRVEVQEVQIPYTVFDGKGNLVLDIPQKDFQIFENGVEQEIRYFSAPANLPLRFGILIDTSSSTRPRLDFEKEAAMQLGYYVLSHHNDHQGFLMTFDHTPEVAQDFTTNPDHLTMAIDKLQAGGGTALLDAIIEACEKKMMTSPGPGLPRRVLVLFSDGDDNLSQHSLDQTIDVALRADVRIFAVSTQAYGQTNPGQQVLKRLVEATNGQLYTPLNTLPSASYATGYISKRQLYESQNSVYAPGTGEYSAELHMVLTKALEAIGNELTNQYAIGYIPTNPNLDGTFRPVEIRTRRKNTEIRAKKGYYAVP